MKKFFYLTLFFLISINSLNAYMDYYVHRKRVWLMGESDQFAFDTVMKSMSKYDIGEVTMTDYRYNKLSSIYTVGYIDQGQVSFKDYQGIGGEKLMTLKFTYNDRDEVTKITSSWHEPYLDSSRPILLYKYEYLENDKIDKVYVSYGYDEKYYINSDYIYDDEGILIQKKEYSLYGLIVSNEYKYDKKGNILEYSFFDDRDYITIYSTYNENNNVIEKRTAIFRFGKNRNAKKELYKYNDQNQVIKYEEFGKTGLKKYSTYEYDDDGDCIQMKIFNKHAMLLQRFKYEYQRLGNGVISEMRILKGFSTGKLRLVHVYSFKYELY